MLQTFAPFAIRQFCCGDQLLGQVFSADSFTLASGETEVGIFILILQHEPNNPNQVFGAILGPGDNP
jgi:hypothetical protein